MLIPVLLAEPHPKRAKTQIKDRRRRDSFFLIVSPFLLGTVLLVSKVFSLGEEHLKACDQILPDILWSNDAIYITSCCCCDNTGLLSCELLGSCRQGCSVCILIHNLGRE